MTLVNIGREHLLKDAKLRPYVSRIRLDDIVPTFDVYEGLLRSIVSQQLSVKAADTIYARFLDSFEQKYPDAQKLQRMDIEQLRSVGLSRQKSQYIRNVASFFLEQELFEYDWNKDSDADIISMLTAIKGVGKWTVEMILMFTLDRPDILPVGDLGIQQSMADIFELTSTKKELIAQMQEVAAPWSPHRTLACRYLWAYKDILPQE